VKFYYDLETNGLLRKQGLFIHCMSYAFDDQPVQRAVGLAAVKAVVDQLLPATMCIAHNEVGFDAPVLKRFGMDLKARGHILFDTKVVCSVVDPEYSGTHSLKDWGVRVNAPKDDYQERCEAAGIDPWAEYTEEMGTYCDQDVDTLRKIDRYLHHKYLSTHDWSTSLLLEHDIAAIMARQAYVGVRFDLDAANKLVQQLTDYIAERTTYCAGFIKPKCVQGEPVAKAFKKNGAPSAVAWKALGLEPGEKDANVLIDCGDWGMSHSVNGVTIGGEFDRVSFSEYDLDSRHQVIQLLMLHGWTPTEWTEKGNPKFTEDSITAQLGGIGKALAERFVAITRLGQVRGWLSKVREDGRIEARAFANATPTGRMRHSVVVNVPRPGTMWGKEMRALFCVPEGKVQVGCDAAGLELRMLAHYMGDEEYTRQILSGDIHWFNVQLMGLVPKGTKRIKEGPGHEQHDAFRNVAKTFIYALIYGAGDAKIGSVVAGLPGFSGTEADGALLRQRFFTGLPKYGKLMERIEQGIKKKWLMGLDGRKLYVRHNHAGLNTLMQSAGSILVKAATSYTHKKLRRLGIPFEQIIHMHDEAQFETTTEANAKIIGETFDEAMRWAEKRFKVRCPLAGDYKMGRNWMECH